MAIIQRLAVNLVGRLMRRDPLSERVHLSKAQFALYGLSSIIITSLRRLGRTGAASLNVRKRDA